MAMDDDRFWHLIQRAHDASPEDMDGKCDEIRDLVGALPATEAAEFGRIFDAKMIEAYDYRLWGAAYVMHGGCGDDSFNDFRSSLISRGRTAFERALSDPDGLAAEYFDDDLWFFEGYAYAVVDGVDGAFMNDGNSVRRAEPISHPDTPKGNPWDDGDLESLYPRLTEKFRSHGFATMSVRTAVPSDARAYAEFSQRVFVVTFGAQNDPKDVEEYLAKTFGEEHQGRALRDPSITVLLATSGETILGYAQLRIGEAVPEVEGDAPLEIQRFYVDHEWHGKGVAQRLMYEVEQFARSKSRGVLWLGVWEKNPRAIAFYEKCGFAKVGRAVFVLGSDRQNDFVMSRRLVTTADPR